MGLAKRFRICSSGSFPKSGDPSIDHKLYTPYHGDTHTNVPLLLGTPKPPLKKYLTKLPCEAHEHYAGPNGQESLKKGGATMLFVKGQYQLTCLFWGWDPKLMLVVLHRRVKQRVVGLALHFMGAFWLHINTWGRAHP